MSVAIKLCVNFLVYVAIVVSEAVSLKEADRIQILHFFEASRIFLLISIINSLGVF